MHRRLLSLLLLVALALPLSASQMFGNSTLGGVNGYLVVPSAEPAAPTDGPTVTTGYSAIFTGGTFAHVPYFRMGFAKQMEIGVSMDIAEGSDLLVNAKWRLFEENGTSFALGTVAQAIDVQEEPTYAAQTYLVSTFDSSIMGYPSKTSVLIGYTFDHTLTSDIDFAMAFETPFMPELFKKQVDILMDFGNVSYSTHPNAGNADNRGMLNVGLRLLPIEFVSSTYIAIDIRALDLFDSTGRSLSVGASITFRQ